MAFATLLHIIFHSVAPTNNPPMFLSCHQLTPLRDGREGAGRDGPRDALLCVDCRGWKSVNLETVYRPTWTCKHVLTNIHQRDLRTTTAFEGRPAVRGAGYVGGHRRLLLCAGLVGFSECAIDRLVLLFLRRRRRWRRRRGARLGGLDCRGVGRLVLLLLLLLWLLRRRRHGLRRTAEVVAGLGCGPDDDEAQRQESAAAEGRVAPHSSVAAAVAGSRCKELSEAISIDP